MMLENLKCHEDSYQSYKEILDRTNNGTNDEILEYCLNFVKDNIILCVNNKNPTDKVIKELFKRGMAKKYNIDHNIKPWEK